MRRGALALEHGPKRQVIESTILDIIEEFEEAIVPLSLEIAEAWAALSLRNKQAGQSVGVVDELIAATAIVHGLTVVTRNTRHFEHSGCRLLSPCSG